MPNAIKYNTSAETLALKKGNFWIGTGAVGKGPTSTTGYWNGITPPSGGYTIYLNKVSNGPSIYVASNDAQLIVLTNQIAGQSYTSTTQCFDYYYGQTDKMCVYQDYPIDFPYIVLDGLTFYLDAGVTLSYPGVGTTWTDVNGLGTKNNGTLTNGPTYNSANGGSIVFDGGDDYVNIGTGTTFNLGGAGKTFSIGICFNRSGVWGGWTALFTKGDNSWRVHRYGNGTGQLAFGTDGFSSQDTVTNTIFNTNTWYNVICVYDGTSKKIYVNGVLDTNVNVTGTLGNNSYPVYIGENSQASGRVFNGKISLTQIYNRALSSTEILQNYQVMIPRFVGENIVTNGLVLYLDAGYNPSYSGSGTNWYDISGYGNNGTLTNGPTFNSGNGGSIVFDGTDDYVSTNNNSSISGSNPYTFEIFLNVNSSEIGSGRRGWFIWQGLGSQATNQLIGLAVNNGYIEIAHWNNDTTYTNSIINFGNWQHIVTTYSGGTERIYINGVNTDTKSIGTLSIVDGKITIAAVPGDSSSVNTLNCQISLHKIYNRALSASEVLQNYNAQKGRFGL
jgi:hypothetical protein